MLQMQNLMAENNSKPRCNRIESATPLFVDSVSSTTQL